MPTLKAYGRNVLVYEIPGKREYGSGFLVVPDAYIKKPTQGIVQQVGHLVKEVKPGDHVIFEELTGNLLEIQGRRVWLFPEYAIRAKIVHEAKAVDGLYHRDTPNHICVQDECTLDHEYEYFLATIESAIMLIAEAIKEDNPVEDVRVLGTEEVDLYDDD